LFQHDPALERYERYKRKLRVSFSLSVTMCFCFCFCLERASHVVKFDLKSYMDQTQTSEAVLNRQQEEEQEDGEVEVVPSEQQLLRRRRRRSPSYSSTVTGHSPTPAIAIAYHSRFKNRFSISSSDDNKSLAGIMSDLFSLLPVVLYLTHRILFFWSDSRRFFRSLDD
jgi:hypothetical protein